MKRVFALFTVMVMAVGASFAQTEPKEYRFEIGVEKGSPSVISGPEIKDISNTVGRIGVSPSHNFQITLNYTKWDGKIAKNDVLSQIFAAKVNKGKSTADQLNFRNAVFDKRDIEIKMYELGLVKTIPLGGKHWESFVGVTMGVTNSVADVDWIGATKRNPDGLAVPAHPSFHGEDDNSFTTSVKGGVRYAVVNWFAIQADLKISPIGSVFSEDINMMEANLGVLFRFGKL